MTNKNVMYMICAVAIFIILFPVTGLCQLKALDDAELSEIYAEGFSSFAINPLPNGNDEAVAWFNINTYQFTEIDSLKLGYHDQYDYKDPTPGFAWDEDWTNVTIGSDYTDPSKDFHTEGVYFKAEFSDINDPSIRELKSITFGADYVQGEITADFNSFSGTIDDSNNNTPEYNGHALNLGTKTITADPTKSGTGSEFSISLSIDGYDKGYWVTFTKATVTP
jgi:hypothetical protein